MCALTAAGQHAPIPTFVHHRNRLTAGQQQAWDRWWSVRGREVADLLSGAEPFAPASWFGRTAPLVLEIGSGMGESTAALAAADPHVDHIAVEVFEPGLAHLLMRLADVGSTNVALLRGDAVALLRECVPLHSLTGIRIFFPDPWPKRRHHKRRLVQPEFVALAASRLRPGGTLHLATDWDDYAVQMRATLRRRTAVGEHRGERSGWLDTPSGVATGHQVREAGAAGRPCGA